MDMEYFCQYVELAKDMVRDGEGATKLLEVTVKQAASFTQAKRVAKSIVNSPLVTTAILRTDPNWGRVLWLSGSAKSRQISFPKK